MRTERVEVRLTKEEKAKLDLHAATRRRTVSSMFTEWVEKLPEPEEKKSS